MTAVATDVASERDPETVALFIEESMDGLQRMERLLMEAERGAAAAEMIATMFREVHTIKGTSGFLNFGKIQSLAHATEDVLACLRDGSLAARPEIYANLMEARDLLRRLIENVRREQDEGPDEVAAVIAKLSARGEPAPVAKLPPPAAEAHNVEAPGDEARGADGTVRVSVGLLDSLMDLIGELVLARNQFVQTVATTAVGGRLADGSLAQDACRRLSAVTTELQEQVMKTRLQPVARVFDKVPRLVRELGKTTGKLVNPYIHGTRTEIDRALVEALRDPVMHIVRNAIDHGIEAPDRRVAAGKPAAGQLWVRAAHEGGVVTVEIEDDGRGIDPAALRRHAVERGLLISREAEALTDREALALIFRPGFSTASKVTAISGRGVGMDVVRTQVEQAGGQVEIVSTPGKGTCVRLKMPLTLAIIPVLLVSAGGQRFAIPQASLLELLFLDGAQARVGIEKVRGVPIHRLRGGVLPLVCLASLLGLPEHVGTREGTHVAVVGGGEHRYGLTVDAIHDTEEIVVKPIHGTLKRLGCYAGAAVLGDGGVALILDVKDLAARAGVAASVARKQEDAVARGERSERTQMMVFRAGAEVQCVVPVAMVARLERVPSSAFERVGDVEVVHYRDGVLPIVRPESVLPIGHTHAAEQQLLIVLKLGQLVAMPVGEILDVVDLPEGMSGAVHDTPFALGTTVVLGRATLVLDVHRIVTELAPQAMRESRRAA
jgi:two-component system chemotaxis sensor kinase CheA